MADELTPTTEHVRTTYATYDGDWQPDFAADFDRWLVARDREMARRAWDEGYRAGYVDRFKERDFDPGANPYREKESES